MKEVSNAASLEGKVALITGATSGVGRAAASASRVGEPTLSPPAVETFSVRSSRLTQSLGPEIFTSCRPMYGA